MSLSGVAGEMWRCLERDGFEHAVEAVSRRYRVDYSVARQDLDALISEMAAVRARPGRQLLRQPSLPSFTRVGSLTLPAWIELGKAGAAAIAVELGLRLLPLPTLCDALGILLDFDDGTADDRDRQAASLDSPTGYSRRAWAVDRVFARWPFPDTCLRRALVMGFLLRVEQPLLRIGAPADGEFIAHAWIETPTARYLAQPGYARFHRTMPGSRSISP